MMVLQEKNGYNGYKMRKQLHHRKKQHFQLESEMNVLAMENENKYLMCMRVWVWVRVRVRASVSVWYFAYL